MASGTRKICFIIFTTYVIFSVIQVIYNEGYKQHGVTPNLLWLETFMEKTLDNNMGNVKENQLKYN